MKVLVLGGTGFIGSAMVAALRMRGAAVTVLCRNPASADKAAGLGAVPLAGDIRSPQDWASQAATFDAAIHAACTFDEAMGIVDGDVVGALLEALSPQRRKRRLLYTAGVWCYGNAVGRVIDERTPFDPVPAFAWGVTHSQQVLAAREVEGIVIHPANVVDRETGGIPPLLLQENAESEVLRAPGSPELRWAVVERHDLAQAYALALDRGRPGQEYLAASEPAVPMGRLAALAGARLGIAAAPRYEPVAYWQRKYGGWAAGYCLDQTVDSRKAVHDLGWAPGFRLA